MEKKRNCIDKNIVSKAKTHCRWHRQNKIVHNEYKYSVLKNSVFCVQIEKFKTLH
jgi:hypothetical protein